MRRMILVLTFLTLASMACTLAGGGSQDFDSDPTLDPDLVMTLTANRPTATPTATTTPTLPPTTQAQSGSTSGSTSGVSLPPPCYPRTDWPVYTVVRGDTLGGIAGRVNSTVNTLALANCLSNPNVLEVGWQLRVPRLPPPPTATYPPPPTLTPGPQYRGALARVQVGVPYNTNFDGHSYTVPPSVSLTLRWPEAPFDVTRIEFYALITSPGSGRVLVGTDYNAADGAGVVYHLDTGVEYSAILTATAFVGDVRVMDTALDTGLVVRPTAPEPVPSAGYVAASPFLTFPSGTYTVWANSVLTLSWREARLDALRVEFYLIVPQPQGQPATTLIGTDYNAGDGAAITWTVPANLNGSLYAVSVLPSGRNPQTLSPIGIQSVRRYGSVYVDRCPAQDGWVQLPAGQNVTVLWTHALMDQTVRVDFYMTPTGTNTENQRTLIGTDTNLADHEVAIQWAVPTTGLSAHLSAVGTLSNGQQIETDQYVQVYADPAPAE